MKKATEFEERLAQDFIFMRRGNPMAPSRYREHGVEFEHRGWNQVIYSCCLEIAKLLNRNGKEPYVAPECIKEESGRIKFSFNAEKNMQKHIDKITAKWELLSEYVCQNCGETGYKRPTAPVTTLCGNCYIEYIESAKERRYQERQGKMILTQEVAQKLIQNDNTELTGGYIVIPEGYEIIDDFAFDVRDVCLSTFLNYPTPVVKIPGSIVKIGYQAFDGVNPEHFQVDEDSLVYKNMQEVLFDKTGKHLQKYPRGSDRYTYTVPDGVESIGEEAFMDSRLESIILPDGLNVIGPEAFSGCYRLDEITLPDSVSQIWDTAFRKCTFSNIIVGKNNKNYVSDDGVLYNKDKTVLLKYPAKNPQEHYRIPDSVLVIDVAAFSNCCNLKEVVIPEGVVNINNGAFAGCTFEMLYLPSSVSWLGYRAFEGCDELKKIIHAPGAIIVGSETFADCEAKILPISCK